MTNQTLIISNVFHVYSKKQIISRIEKILRTIGFFIDHERIRHDINTYNFSKGVCSGYCVYYIGSPNAREIIYKWKKSDITTYITQFHLDMVCYVLIVHFRLLEHPSVKAEMCGNYTLFYDKFPKTIESSNNKYKNMLIAYRANKDAYENIYEDYDADINLLHNVETNNTHNTSIRQQDNTINKYKNNSAHNKHKIKSKRRNKRTIRYNSFSNNDEGSTIKNYIIQKHASNNEYNNYTNTTNSSNTLIKHKRHNEYNNKNHITLYNNTEYELIYNYQYDKAKDYEYYLTILSRFIHGYSVKYKSLIRSREKPYCRMQYFKLLFTLIQWSVRYTNAAVILITEVKHHGAYHCSVLKHGNFFDPNKNHIVTGYKEILAYYNSTIIYRFDRVRNIYYKCIYHDNKIPKTINLTTYSDIATPDLPNTFNITKKDVFNDFCYMRNVDKREKLLKLFNEYDNYDNLFNQYKLSDLQRKIYEKRYHDITEGDIDHANMCDCMYLYVNYEKLTQIKHIKKYPENSVDNIARNMIHRDDEISSDYLFFSDVLWGVN